MLQEEAAAQEEAVLSGYLLYGQGHGLELAPDQFHHHALLQGLSDSKGQTGTA